MSASPSSTMHQPSADDLDKDVEGARATEKTTSPKSTRPLPPSIDLPTGKKILITAVLCLMTLSLTYASSAYASSVNNIKSHFDASTEVVLLGVALFVLGFAVGPLCFGPMAHLIGGRAVYIGTYLCFTAFAFAASEAPTLRTLIVTRFFMGVFGSSSLNNTAATIGEMVMPQDTSKYMIWYALSAFGGPGLGPVIASFIDHRAGFRWNLRVQAIFIAATTIACIILVPETGSPLLKQKGRAGDGSTRRSFIYSTVKRALYGPFIWLFTVFPYTFQGIRHWSEESTGLIFISLLVGFFGSFFVMGFLQLRYETKERAKLPAGTQLPPETKLQQMLWAAFLPPVGLFIFAWTAPFRDIHWIAPAIGMALFALGMMVVFTSLIPYLVAYSGPEAPLALAASTFTRAAFGCGFPLFTLQMYSKLTVQGATSLLAGITLLLVPMPWVMKRYGAVLRARSRRSK